jgi:hypothetical protein
MGLLTPVHGLKTWSQQQSLFSTELNGNVPRTVQKNGKSGQEVNLTAFEVPHLYLPGVTTSGSTCECGNKPSGSMKCGEFLDYLRTSK